VADSFTGRSSSLAGALADATVKMSPPGRYHVIHKPDDIGQQDQLHP
jgi:hypothetical protein